MISVVIADDQLLLRESLKFILDNDAEIRVVGTAGNGREAVDLCVRLQPDIILMDIGMPELDGVGATKAIKEQYPGPRSSFSRRSKTQTVSSRLSSQTPTAISSRTSAIRISF